MRSITLTTITALALSATVATAGGLPEVVMEPEVIEQATSSSSAGIIVPLLLLLIIAAIASGGGGSAPLPT